MSERLWLTWAGVGLLLMCARPAVAGDGLKGFSGICIPRVVSKFCCDDYDRKPLPPVRCVDKFLCDDYCPKPWPCVPGVGCFECDDYCPKPFPPIFCKPKSPLACPPRAPWCESPAAGHASPARTLPQ